MSVRTSSQYPLSFSTRGRGPNLLLIHGGTGSNKHWIQNIDHLSKHFCVWAIDLPGFGESPPPSDGVDSTNYLDYVFDCLQPFPFMHEPLLIGAFSFGSVVASGLALKLGSQLKKLSLIGPAGFGVKRDIPIDTRSMRSAGDSIQAQEAVIRHNLRAIMLYYPASITKEMVEMHRWHIQQTRFDSRILSLTPLLLQNLKQVACPLQIMWGEYDQYAYPTVEARMQATQQALPTAHLAKIARAGHWAQYENAEDTNRAMLDFFKN